MSKSIFKNSSKMYFFNTCFDKNHLKNLISWLLRKSGEKITVDFLEALKEVGFHQATVAGVSLGVDDLVIPTQKAFFISQAKADVSLCQQQSLSGNVTSVEKSQQLISTWNQTSETLRKTAVQNFKNTNQVNPVYMMAFSGARGNISQVRQLVALRGLMADPQGGILEFPIQSNFREGLTITEYLISCYGARKGLVDTALRTATSGYLTRRLVDAAQHVLISIKDCKTDKGIRLPRKNLEQNLIGRVLAKDIEINTSFTLKKNQVISPKLSQVIANYVKQTKFVEIKTIVEEQDDKNQITKKEFTIREDLRFNLVRSPLTCQANNSLCQLCYGWNLAHGTLVTLGEAVGVIAAQSIGEPGTQLTMRTFHTGGVGVFSDQAMKYFLAPYDGIIHFIEGVPGHFVRTPYGKIVYMVKNTTTTKQSIIFQLESFDTKKINYSLKNQDLPPGSILLVRQGERVRTGQILAQSSQIKKSNQKMPESTHPVFSPLDGEIHFYSMEIGKENILELKKRQKNKKINKNKQQKEEEKIGPDIQILKGIGSFWVFSSENQKEFHSAKSFLRSGDLVSKNSSLFQYDFYIDSRSIFSTIKKNSCIGVDGILLPVQQTNFHKFSYSMILKKKSFSINNLCNTSNDIIFFHKKGVQNFLIWSPSNTFLPSSGYYFNFILYSQRQNKINVPSGKVSGKVPGKILNKLNPHNRTPFVQASFFYLPQNIQKSKLTSPYFIKKSKKTYYLDLKNSRNTANSSLFQLKSSLFSSFESFLPTKKEFNKKTRSEKIKKLFYKQKNYLVNSGCIKKTEFPNFALKKVKRSLSLKSDGYSGGFLQKNKGWLFVPKTKKIHLFSKETQKLILSQQGKSIDAFFFLNSKNCIEIIPQSKIGVLKYFKNKNITNLSKNHWYCWSSLLSQNFFGKSKKSPIKSSSNSNKIVYKACLCFYQRAKKTSSNYLTNHTIAQNNDQNKWIHKLGQQQIKVNLNSRRDNFLCIYALNEYTLPKKSDLLTKWIDFNKVKTSQHTLSPVFTKQQATIYQKNKVLKKKFQAIARKSDGWLSSRSFLNIFLNFNSQQHFNKVHKTSLLSTCLKNFRIPLSGLNLFFYTVLSFPKNGAFRFQVFENCWVLPSTKLTTGFIKIKKEGEFRRYHSKINISTTSLLTTKNLVTLDLKNIIRTTNDIQEFTKNKQLKIGTFFRSGTEIFDEITSSNAGLIVSKNFSQLTLRLGVPFLASRRGLVHVFENELVQKGDLLVTLKSRRLQTEDIVQGIPKIEQLFEARETQGGSLILNSIHSRLRNYFLDGLKNKLKKEFDSNNYEWIEFLKKVWNWEYSDILEQQTIESIEKIQFFLVHSILEAYSSQGVKIAQKHVEVIVRQMTSRVRIVSSKNSGLVEGEIIQFSDVQKLNEKLKAIGKRRPIYEPIILGITKTVFHSESFLLAASFQEVNRVLVKSALSKKKDFLRGLHENVMIGEVVPTGTGLVTKGTGIVPKPPGVDLKSSQLEENLNLSNN